MWLHLKRSFETETRNITKFKMSKCKNEMFKLENHGAIIRDPNKNEQEQNPLYNNLPKC